ncbi:hypothetical protein V5R04_15610 [Jonesiaceae bacterium BS-20]|uniref:Phage tail protein n=1 Tax=Jonesiaceae bacterium BS-20 TaxID=3120821 RepID=A0AAU7DWF5_9MICO
MAEFFSDLLETDSGLVRKWGRQLVAVQDYSEAVPEQFFDETGLPVLPSTAKQLGFITTEGSTAAQAVSATPTNMLQILQPVRNDLESKEKTYAMAFGEGSNAYVWGVYNGQKVADFPASPGGAFLFSGGEPEFPLYRLWLIAADGVGANARYRIEYAPAAQVTATTDRTLARSNPETLGFTFSCNWDTAEDTDLMVMENGPGLIEP